MSFDVIYSAPQGLAQQRDGLSLDEAEQKFMHFLLETQERNTFIYR